MFSSPQFLKCGDVVDTTPPPTRTHPLSGRSPTHGCHMLAAGERAGQGGKGSLVPGVSGESWALGALWATACLAALTTPGGERLTLAGSEALSVWSRAFIQQPRGGPADSWPAKPAVARPGSFQSTGSTGPHKTRGRSQQKALEKQPSASERTGSPLCPCPSVTDEH